MVTDVNATAIKIKSQKIENPGQIIQMAIDYLLPGNSSLDTRMDVRNLINDDYDANLFFYGSINIDKAIQQTKSRPVYAPKLRTACAPKRPTHLMTALPALYKRNMVNGFFAFESDYTARALETIEYACDKICVSDWREKMAHMREHPVRVNEESVVAWAECQDTAKLNRLEKEYKGRQLTDLDVNEYSLFLKPNNKPPVDTSVQTEVSQPQTVVFHEVSINAHFGPVFRQLEENWNSLLLPHVLYNKKKNIDQIEEFINKVDSSDPEKEFRYLENDFSAYDKSQHVSTWTLEREIYRSLGLDPELLEVWMDAHWFTKIRSAAVGLTMYVLFQRKSGDVTTSFGNTIVNMLTLFYTFKLTTFVYALFLGDDSLIKVRLAAVDIDVIRSGPTRMMDAFNLICKFFVFLYGYFCGYIITKVDGENKLISDCLRRATKLGRLDINDARDFKEHWVSFGDVTRNYDDVLVVQQAAEALAERRADGDMYMLELLYYALNSIGKSYKEYRSLYDDELSASY